MNCWSIFTAFYGLPAAITNLVGHMKCCSSSLFFVYFHLSPLFIGHNPLLEDCCYILLFQSSLSFLISLAIVHRRILLTVICSCSCSFSLCYYAFIMQEQVRKDISKSRAGGFSLSFVVLIALLGILIGYLVKRA